MGMNASAKIFYGYVWEPEPSTPPWPDYDEDTDEDLDEWDEGGHVEKVAKERGHVDPWDAYVEIPSGSMPYDQKRAVEQQWVADHRSEIDAWYEIREAIKKELSFDVVSVDGYGSLEHGYTTPFISVAETVVRGDWSSPMSLGLTELAELEEIHGDRWRSELARFVEISEADLTDAQGPGWFVVCTWG